VDHKISNDTYVPCRSKWNNDEFFRGAYSYRSVEGDKVTGDICSILSEPVMKSDSKGNDVMT